LLPKPDCDDGGKPVWEVTEGQISKAYRKRSLAVHPDKNPSLEAKEAFERLSDANRALKDPVRRVRTPHRNLSPTLSFSFANRITPDA
jgi:hypothetical protein